MVGFVIGVEVFGEGSKILKVFLGGGENGALFDGDLGG